MVPAIGARGPTRRGESRMGISDLGKIWSGGQGRNRTNDTRIFSTGESRRGHQKAEDREWVFGGLTEPAWRTEPIPSLSDRTPDRTGPGAHAGQGVAAGWTELEPNHALSVVKCHLSDYDSA